jgi:hypothetical protein
MVTNYRFICFEEGLGLICHYKTYENIFLKQ